MPIDEGSRSHRIAIARAGGNAISGDEAIDDGIRIMGICNACRYCEGYCAVFPAMTRRLSFAEADIDYLANLCHNCGGCYHSCQYAPPHPFAVNVPLTFAQVRKRSYKKYAWPAPLAIAFERNGLAVGLALAASLLLALLFGTVWIDGVALFAPQTGAGAFYRIIAHNTMALAFGAVSIFVVCAFAIGFARFWRSTGEPAPALATARPLREAVFDVLTLRYLDGGGNGDGCPYPGDQPSQARRLFHHLTMYGFLLCFASTSVATFYHYGLHELAPYALLSLPVLLGTTGGVGLTIGPLGLFVLKRRRDAALADASQDGMDIGFIALLVLTAVTGLALLAFRSTPAMGCLLLIHLAAVLALFITLPYGKFVHGSYRFAALLRFAIERKQPSDLTVSE